MDITVGSGGGAVVGAAGAALIVLCDASVVLDFDFFMPCSIFQMRRRSLISSVEDDEVEEEGDAAEAGEEDGEDCFDLLGAYSIVCERFSCSAGGCAEIC